jgi:hypothetical protein
MEGEEEEGGGGGEDKEDIPVKYHSLNFIPFKTVTSCIDTMIPMMFAFNPALYV